MECICLFVFIPLLFYTYKQKMSTIRKFFFSSPAGCGAAVDNLFQIKREQLMLAGKLFTTMLMFCQVSSVGQHATLQ